MLQVELVQPLLIAGVAADVALDTAGRWRHSVPPLRIRTDVSAADVPFFGEGNLAVG